jgi:plastocyanin
MSAARHLLGAASAALLGLAVLGLVTDDPAPPATPAGPGEVQIAGFAFGPEALTVARGSTVTWVNADATAHTVDSATGSELQSGEIAGGATFEQTFSMPGTYEYICAIHPSMQGTVEVTG